MISLEMINKRRRDLVFSSVEVSIATVIGSENPFLTQHIAYHAIIFW